MSEARRRFWPWVTLAFVLGGVIGFVAGGAAVLVLLATLQAAISLP